MCLGNGGAQVKKRAIREEGPTVEAGKPVTKHTCAEGRPKKRRPIERTQVRKDGKRAEKLNQILFEKRLRRFDKTKPADMNQTAKLGASLLAELATDANMATNGPSLQQLCASQEQISQHQKVGPEIQAASKPTLADSSTSCGQPPKE